MTGTAVVVAPPDWFSSGYKDAQGKDRRVIVGQTEQALTDYAGKHGKRVEQTYQHTRVVNRRTGQVVKATPVTRWYGLLSS